MSGPIPERGVGAADSGAGPDTAFDAFAREQRQVLVAFAWTLTGDVGVAEDVARPGGARALGAARRPTLTLWEVGLKHGQGWEWWTNWAEGHTRSGRSPPDCPELSAG